MQHRCWLVLVLLTTWVCGCGSNKAVTVDDETLTASECGEPHVQKLITYCASPQAADLALQNAELMGPGRQTEVPYSPVPVGDSPIQGPDDAPITIVMFTDLECPYCRELHVALGTLRKEMPDDIRIVFKHTPLSFHELAVPSALGALAAREQGKFWEYVDRVYENQATLSETTLLEHAAALSLDLEQFRNDFGNAKHVAAIEADMALASQAGVRGTPTMFVNGLRVAGLFPLEDLRALMSQQKKFVERLTDAGVKQKDLYWRTVSAQYEQVAPSGINEVAEDTEPQGPVIAHIPIDDSPVKGAKSDDALVTIVTFSDFQCPFCAGATQIVDEVLGKAEDTRLSFRHFPLGNHPRAGAAALAAIVAQEGGKFWEYHDLLFANQDDLSDDALDSHATKLGLNPKTIAEAMSDPDRQSRVIDDQRLGVAIGVQGTPTFFINGVMVMGIESAEAFEGMVNSQRELGRLVKEETGLSGEALYKAIVERNLALSQGGNDS